VKQITVNKITRRRFIGNVSAAGAVFAIAPAIGAAPPIKRFIEGTEYTVTINLLVNGDNRVMTVDTRVTLLDLLREKLHLKGSKKGCDHGQCGACTVIYEGKRANSCLIPAGMCDGATVTSIEGLAQGGKLHPVQEAFIKHDAFQCGYCTPGQICSAVGLLREGHAKNSEDIRELMSGNICRCGAYRNIHDAIKEVQQSA
jgi:xanthine dehydrogenase YagT iron-sulfur-binding subunit